MESILSVGIDVGTTTTKVAFSRLRMENAAGPFAIPRISVVEKQVLYRSEPFFTPLKNNFEIDVVPLIEIVRAEYAHAGIDPSEVGAGAVIITGESARKDNASALLHQLSGLAGEFVVSAAGPDMEAVIAGKGSGAYEYSKKYHGRVINVDIGGGTTNSVLFDNGRTVTTGCIDVGGRIVRTDEHGTVTGVSPAAERIANAEGLPLFVGMTDEGALTALCDVMARLIAEQINASPRSDLYHALRSPHSAPFEYTGGVDALCYSGGVADAILGRFPESNRFCFGDIGILLGKAIARNRALNGLETLTAGATIAATVIGAGSYATTVSGSTIDAAATALPLRDVPVYCLTQQELEQLFAGECDAFKKNLAYQVELNGERLAIALRGAQDPSYQQIKQLAHCLATAADACFSHGTELIAVCESDMAKVLGGRLRALTSRPVIAIDGISLETQDQIDIGRPLASGLVVPVVVKTLVFGV